MDQQPSPILYVVATPIGNAADITYRAVETLNKVEVIIAEDTRTTGLLLKRYNIKKKMISYNSYHEARGKKIEGIVKNHTLMAYVSENGTPAISDPGRKIINYCYEHNVKVIPVPGCNAAFCCLSVSGFPSQNVLFYGFLPNKKGKRKKILHNLCKNEKKVLIFYESVHRIKNMLETLMEIDPNMMLFIGREMTKKYEQYIRKTVKDVLNMYEDLKIKGEFVVIINNTKKKDYF
ncbi:MAG TPA: 16S rRNA (cytidine(1402)-2'-O)-methyltransferase [Spirochaetota bacterium]|nr:16S rRNA (cytidine(1402)-2'-O)-methyltransferase [Spirochaetota bacterium]